MPATHLRCHDDETRVTSKARRRTGRADVRPAKVTEPFTDAAYHRKRVFARIDAARRRPIVWLAAPPGAGKTTVVASYLRSRKLGAAWYRIDAGDTDAAGLFYYLRLATEHLTDPRAAPLPLWTPPAAGALPAFTRRFFEDLFGRLPAHGVIVFDDYQESPPDTSWAQAFEIGLAAVPRGCSVIVTSRAEPPPAFARRIVAGELEVVGWEELRLSIEEASAIARMRASPRHARNAAEIRRLYELAGGLAAGLVLLLASTHGPGDALPTHSGHDSHDVFDYFATELFQRSDPETQRFLLESAFLPTMSEVMVQQCAGPAARRIVRRLRRHELFVDRLASPEPIYRYHPLFRAFLLDLAAHTLSTGELASLRRRAATLLAESGQTDVAFTLFREAGDITAAAGIVAREGAALLAQGRRQTLEQWLHGLPDETVAASGWLSLWKGLCAIGSTRSRAADVLTRAFDVFADTGDAIGARIAWSGAVQAIMLEGQQFNRLDEWLARLESRMPAVRGPIPPEVDLRMAAAELLALQYRKPGSAFTHVAAERAVQLSEHASELGERLMTGALLVMYYVFFDGDVNRASAVVRTLRDARTRGEQDPMVHVTVRLAEAIHAWASGEEATAVAATVDGFEAAEAAGIDAWNNRLLGLGIAAALGMRDLESSRRFLASMARDAPARGRFDLGNYHYYAAWDAYQRGEVARAEHEVRLALAIADEVDFPLARSLARIALAIVCAESARLDAARDYIRDARAIAQEMASRFLLFSCGLVEADIAARRSEPADDILERGLAIGRECGCFNVFWLPERTLARLAVRALEAGRETAYVQELVRRRRLRPDVLPVHLQSWPWPVRIYTLGRFELEVDGAAVHSAGAQRVPLRLLKAAIAFGRRNVRKDRLIDTIWPDAEGDAGARAFDTALHRLRNLLVARDVLGVSDGCLHLHSELCWTDVGAVEQLLTDVERAIDEGGGTAAAVLLDRALDLYRGKLLDSDEHEPWAIAPRQKLHERFLDSVLRVVRGLVATGELERAIAICERALAVDESCDALYQRLIACHLRVGSRAEAVRVYDRCRNVLALAGVKPSRETQELLRRMP